MQGIQKRLSRCFGLLLLVLSSVSCAHSDRAIPTGVYLGEAGLDQIYVDSQGMYFAISLNSGSKGRPDWFARQYHDYSLSDDGKIRVFSRSADFFFGVNQFEWRWIDGKIAKTYRRGGGRTTWFTRVEEDSGSPIPTSTLEGAWEQ